MVPLLLIVPLFVFRLPLSEMLVLPLPVKEFGCETFSDHLGRHATAQPSLSQGKLQWKQHAGYNVGSP